jgi:hypothetical protein
MRIVMRRIRPPLTPPTQEGKTPSKVISFLLPLSSFLEKQSLSIAALTKPT